MQMFKEILDFKAARPKQQSKNTFIFGYEGEADSMKIKLLSNKPEKFQNRILADKQKDTLYYWFTPFFETDSLIFEVTNKNNYRDTLIARFKDQFKDSLVLTPTVRGDLAFDKEFSVSSNTPISSVNDQLISMMDKDSVQVPFSVTLDDKLNEAIFKLSLIHI